MLSSSSSSSSDSEQSPRSKRRKAAEKDYLYLAFLTEELHYGDILFEHAFGVTKNGFITLKRMLVGHIEKNKTKFENMQPIRGRDRLALCLRFLASGRTFTSLCSEYCVPPKVLETIVKEVCEVIIEHIRPIAMPQPTTEMWEQIAADYRRLYDMPNCLGSMNGRFINIVGLKTHILLVVVDAHYRFVLIDVGDYSDVPRRVWPRSELAKLFEQGDELQIPAPKLVDKYPHPLRYVVVASAYFPGCDYMLSNYKDPDLDELYDGHKILEDKLTSVKKVADEALILLRRRWLIIQGAFPVTLPEASRIITACCCLHNYFTTPQRPI